MLDQVFGSTNWRDEMMERLTGRYFDFELYQRDIRATTEWREEWIEENAKVKRLKADIAALQAEITKKDKEIELLRKAMIKADFAYYFSPDYLDEDTKE